MLFSSGGIVCGCIGMSLSVGFDRCFVRGSVLVLLLILELLDAVFRWLIRYM